MAKKKYLDLTGLTKYDTEIKNYISSHGGGGSGTNVTLNGTDLSGSSASFYAPTSSGTSGQMLVSGGTNASPTWADKQITEITTQYVGFGNGTDSSTRTYIKAAGIYKLTYSGTKYIYYYGTNTTSTYRHTVTGSSGTVYLHVSMYSTTYFEWWYINGGGVYPTIYYGYTANASTGGSTSSKALNNLLTGISNYVKNNLTHSTSETTYALSAYQGYVLNTTKTGFKDTVAAPTDLNPYDTVPTEGSTKPITSGGVYTALNNITAQILWENLSPGSSFGAQTISLTSNTCNYFIVEFAVDNSYTTTVCDTVIFKVGEGAIATLIAGETGLQAGGAYLNTRLITASTQTSITFSNSWRVGGSADTSHVIPRRVLGFKAIT